MYCRECSKELNDENWAESLRKKNSKICKDCHNIKGKAWRQNNRIRVNELALEAYYRNPKKSHDTVNRARKKLRKEMIAEYGGECVSCGISDIDVLDIDHINNDGSVDRKKRLYGYNLYRKLKKNNWPKSNFQLLCKNCNWKKHLANIRG